MNQQLVEKLRTEVMPRYAGTGAGDASCLSSETVQKDVISDVLDALDRLGLLKSFRISQGSLEEEKTW